MTRYTEVCSENSLNSEFFADGLDFRVPDPNPDDDVIEHVWLEELKSEKIGILVQWTAE